MEGGVTAYRWAFGKSVLFDLIKRAEDTSTLDAEAGKTSGVKTDCSFVVVGFRGQQKEESPNKKGLGVWEIVVFDFRFFCLFQIYVVCCLAMN
jgi:hypothetical protein